MRDIIYRGKTKGGEWEYGGVVIYKKDAFIITEEDFSWSIMGDQGDYDGCITPVLPETVGQYTGLTDKNGKKVFEGDIVRADDYIFSVKYGKCGGTPNADNYGYMGFYLEAVSEGTKLCAKYGLRDDICFFTDIEVIDNIHDNKLLLEVK